MAPFSGKWQRAAGLRTAALVAALAITALPAMGSPVIAIETGPDLTLIRLQAHEQLARDVAKALVGKTGIRIEGIDRLGNTKVTFNFTSVVSVDNIVVILADVAGQEMRRLEPGAYRIGLPQNHAAIKKLEAEAEQARKAGNTAALERALSRILALAPATQPGAMDAVPWEAVRELDALLIKREDRAGAERVQRAWLAITERNRFDEDTGAALAALGRLRLLQGDPVGARGFYERALKLAPKLGKGEASLAARARVGLAAVAIEEKRYEEADAYQAQAEGALKEAAEDYLGIAFAFSRNEGNLLLQAYESKRKDRLEIHLARRAALSDTFPEFFSASDQLGELDELGRVQVDLGKFDRARETSVRALATCSKSGETGHEACPGALHRLALVDLVTGRYVQALEGWRRVCALRVAVLGSEHRSTLAAYADLRVLQRLAAPGAPLPGQSSCPPDGSAPGKRSRRFDLALQQDLGIEAEDILEERARASSADPREVARLREQLARLQAARRLR